MSDVYSIVLLRDKGSCRVCGDKNEIEIIKINPQGPDEENNLISVCSFHADKIRRAQKAILGIITPKKYCDEWL